VDGEQPAVERADLHLLVEDNGLEESERVLVVLDPRFSLSEIKIYRTSWIKRINKIYRKYRTKFKKI
jgi:hypothetical protein